MTNIRNPRPFWVGTSDEELMRSRDECRALGIEWLSVHADAIDDELERRREYRDRLEGAS